ncbi:MAG: hydantoinase/oxoprolinase family protein, partial [Alphaproteobacteria bacterium]|nr:hydantoinase/oxoprolinase family protein [Alphaproteobacteria bacterium]
AGGGMPIHFDLARSTLEREVAQPLGLPLEEAAWGVHRVANATMARALRAVSTERGRDPRDFAILAFGGNGPIHGASLARMLEINRILVPPVPGLFSALGMLFPDVEYHYVRTFKRPLDRLASAELAAAFQAMTAEGAAALTEEGFAPAAHRFERFADLRYVGANSELTVPCAGDADQAQLREAFAALHERQYGYRSDEEAVETMNLRLVARGVPQQPLVPERLSVQAQRGANGARRRAYFGPEIGWAEAAICGRADLGADWRAGPLLVEEFDSTTVVPPGARARRISWDTIEIELEGRP